MSPRPVAPEPVAEQSEQDIVRQLLQVISRELPLRTAQSLLADDLTAHMDGRVIGHGKQAWFKWVQFIHRNADKKMTQLTIVIDHINRENDIFHVNARWRALINGEESYSDLATVSYQVRADKVINIWTHRANYVFIYGRRIADSRIAFYRLLFRLMLWRPPTID